MKAERTLRVTGRGRMQVHPDMTRITLTLEGSARDYGEALRKSAEDTERLKDLLSGFGFARSDLKPLNFSVDTEYKSSKDKGILKQRSVVYRFRHLMKVEFDSDNARLGKILYALAHCPIRPEFRLSYTVTDPEAVKNELIGKAVADAREMAGVLTQAAGVALQEIQSIDYSWEQLDIDVRPMSRMLMADDSYAAADESYDMDLEPEDIEVSDAVTVVWAIG